MRETEVFVVRRTAVQEEIQEKQTISLSLALKFTAFSSLLVLARDRLFQRLQPLGRTDDGLMEKVLSQTQLRGRGGPPSRARDGEKWERFRCSQVEESMRFIVC